MFPPKLPGVAVDTASLFRGAVPTQPSIGTSGNSKRAGSKIVGRRAGNTFGFVDGPRFLSRLPLCGRPEKRRVHGVRRQQRGRSGSAAVRLDAVQRDDDHIARLGALDIERTCLWVRSRCDPPIVGVHAARVDRHRDHAITGLDPSAGGWAKEKVL